MRRVFWLDRDRSAADEARLVESAHESVTPAGVRSAFEHLVRYHERRGVEVAIEDGEHLRP